MNLIKVGTLSALLFIASAIQVTAEERLLQAGCREIESSERASVQISNQNFEACCGKKKKKEGKTKEIIEQAIEQDNGAVASVDFHQRDKAALYYTSHPGAYHFPVLLGDVVELEDGSKWTVNPSQSLLTLTWYSTDVILIMPNHSWTSSYEYALVNQRTGDYVEATITLFLHPLYHSVYNHRIVAIDDHLQWIWLEDGSIWSVLWVDYSTAWQINDTVIIGHNDGLWSSSKPNILINANLKHYVRATCTN